MRCMMRNKRKIYICNRYIAGNINKYHEPKIVYINYQYTNSDSDLIGLGLDFPKYIRIKADLKDTDFFKTGDRVYIGIEPNTNFDGLCKDANYEVDSDPIISLNSIEITLKKLSGKK